MITLNKGQILSTIFSIIMLTVGAYTYITNYKLNSMSDTCSCEIAPINETDVSMQICIKRDDYTEKNNDTFTQYCGLIRTDEEVILNPDPSNQIILLSTQSKRRFNGARFRTHLTQSLELDNCTKTLNILAELGRHKNNVFNNIRTLSERKTFYDYKTLLGLFDPFFDNYLTDLEKYCQKDMDLHQNVCFLIHSLIYNEEKFFQFLICYRKKGHSQIDAEFMSDQNKMYLYLYEKRIKFACNYLMGNPNYAKNTTNTTNYNSTRDDSKMCKEDGYN